MTITLNKEYIYEYVYLLTGSLASTKGDQYACTPDNANALDRYFDSCVNELETKMIHHALATYGTTLQLNQKDITLYISDNNGHLKESAKGAIRTSLRLCLAYMLTSMWLLAFDAQLAATYSASSDSYITDIQLLLAQRETWINDSDYKNSSNDNIDLSASSASKNNSWNDNTDDESIAGPGSDYYYASQVVRDNVLEKPVMPINLLRDEDNQPIVAQN